MPIPTSVAGPNSLPGWARPRRRKPVPRETWWRRLFAGVFATLGSVGLAVFASRSVGNDWLTGLYLFAAGLHFLCAVNAARRLASSE